MKTNSTFFKKLLNRKTNKAFYAATLFIIGLSFSAFWMAVTGNRASARKTENLRGAEAIERLRQNGQYDSLLKAFKAARNDEFGKNVSDLTAAPKAIAQNSSGATSLRPVQAYSICCSSKMQIVVAQANLARWSNFGRTFSTAGPTALGSRYATTPPCCDATINGNLVRRHRYLGYCPPARR